MSAWMTSRVHRSALTQAAIVEQIIEPIEASWLFNELTRINRLALHHRYGDPHPDQMDEEHREVIEAPLDNNVLIKNIGCFRYQCAEYDGWDQEPAMLAIEDLRFHLLAQEGYEQSDAGLDQWYADARNHDGRPWGINRWEDVIATQQTAS